MSKPECTDFDPPDPYEIYEKAMEQEERRQEALFASIVFGKPFCGGAGEAGCADARASAHRAPASTGVQPSNTPPPSSKNDEIVSWVGAEDWLEWCLYVNWNEEWRSLNERLKRAKTYAENENVPSGLDELLFMGGRAKVYPSGMRLGGKKGPYFAYRLEYDGLDVFIAERESAHKNMPSVIFRADGSACLYPGAAECYRKATRMIEALGGTIIRNRLSRVDICLDMPGVDIEPFDRAFLEERYICRAVSKSRHSGTGVTVSIGKAPIMCRIYDKLAEVKLKANPYKNLCMRVYRWGGHLPDAATRVEFELGRDFLKNKGVDSVDDYYRKRGAVLNYLTHDWIRFTQDQVDRENKNQSKARTLPLWQQVRDCLLEWSGSGKGVSLAPLDKAKANVAHLIKVAVGVLKTAAVDQGKTFASPEEITAYLLERIKLYGVKVKVE